MSTPVTPPEQPKSSPLADKVKAGLAIIAVVNAAFSILAMLTGNYWMIFIAIATGLPGAWYLLHQRREKNGATPMKRHWGIVTAVSLAALALAVALTPSSEDSNPTPADKSDTSTTTGSSETTTNTTTTTTETKPSTTTSSSTKATTPATSATPITTTTDADEYVDVDADAPEADVDRPRYIPTPDYLDNGSEDSSQAWTGEPVRQPQADPAPVYEAPAQQPVEEVAPAPVQPQAVEPEPVPSGGSGLTCSQVGRVTHIGDPSYDPRQDRDGDGVGCESYK